jgi:sialic acid synthase SpsE
VSNTNIEIGSIITKEMIGIKRPGGGIDPSMYESLVGKKVVRFIAKDSLLEEDMFE